MPPPVVAVTAETLPDLARELVGEPGARRRLVGLAGAPGCGKSELARALAVAADADGQGRVAVVPLDGFHLADAALTGLGLLDRKGAPETFDAWGFAALLERLRASTSHPVYAPAFERDLEQPLAGAIEVAASVEVALTEGNYLLLDRPGWTAARALLDEVWFVATDDAVRRDRLLARHVEFGKPLPHAREWVDRVDEPNARLVTATRGRADRVLDVSGWVLPAPPRLSG